MPGGRGAERLPMKGDARDGSASRASPGRANSFRGMRRMRMRPQVGVGVAQQRQDRVVERRGRKLDLAGRGQLLVDRNDGAEQLELHLSKHPLVLLAVGPLLPHQRLQPRIGAQPVGVHPGELVPHLQIAQVVGREAVGLHAGARAARRIEGTGGSCDRPARESRSPRGTRDPRHRARRRASSRRSDADRARALRQTPGSARAATAPG